jgi:hypothetical protein
VAQFSISDGSITGRKSCDVESDAEVSEVEAPAGSSGVEMIERQGQGRTEGTIRVREVGIGD